MADSMIEAKTASAALFERACAVLAGGVDSPVRAGRPVGGVPFVQTRGEGPYAYDADGRKYIDYIMAYGPLLLGHAHPALSVGLDEIARRGVCFGSTHEEEITLAERIRAALPSMERIRFTTTGSEAMMSAVRLARAYTGRDLIVKFGGNYHGHFDLALYDAGASAQTHDPSRSGIPAGTMRDVAVARYNDLDDLDRILAGEGERLAAILVEPVVGNMGLVEPLPGFLEGLLQRAHDRGALVVFDEVITWLRLGLPGAQGRFGLRPDLTAVGKILGGGFPIAAFGGRREVMEYLAPDGATFTGGTHAGNPFCVAIAHRVLDYVEEHDEELRAMERRARRLAERIRESLASLGLDYAVVQLESIVDFKFRPGPPTRSYEDQARCDRSAFAAYYHAMRERGVLLPPSQNEVMFLCTEHSDEDIERTAEAIDASLHELRRKEIV
jgi:glutamate-1-semialdehyde 2,1-aminomutase